VRVMTARGEFGYSIFQICLAVLIWIYVFVQWRFSTMGHLEFFSMSALSALLLSSGIMLLICANKAEGAYDTTVPRYRQTAYHPVHENYFAPYRQGKWNDREPSNANVGVPAPPTSAWAPNPVATM